MSLVQFRPDSERDIPQTAKVLQLPTELLLRIADLQRWDQDMRNFRLTCKAFAVVGMDLMCDHLNRITTLVPGPDHRDHHKVFHPYYANRPTWTKAILIDLPRFASMLITLATSFPIRAIENISELRICERPEPRKPLRSIDEMLEKVHLPALRKLSLESTRTSSILPLIKFIDSHARSLKSLEIKDHMLLTKSVDLKLYAAGIAVQLEYKPLFAAMLSILNRPLSLDHLVLGGLDVLLAWRTKEKKVKEPSYNRPTGALRGWERVGMSVEQKQRRRTRVTMNETKGEVQLSRKGNRHRNLKFEGCGAIRKGLQHLHSGAERCLWESSLFELRKPNQDWLSPDAERSLWTKLS